MLALRLVRRDLRGGGRGLWIVLLCLALGVAAIAAVGTLQAATDAGLSEGGRSLLGGDLEIETGAEPVPATLQRWLKARGARLSLLTEMRSLLVTPSGQRQLIDLRAVDGAWPLVGRPVINPPQTVAAGLQSQQGRWGLLVDPLVLQRLGLRAGDTARIGREMFTVRGSLVEEPDRIAGPALFGMPVVINEMALPATGLVVPGSMVSHAVRVVLPDPSTAVRLAAAEAKAFPTTGWRVRRPQDAAPGVGQAIDRTGLFLTLVGLASLLVGGIGVANGVRAWLAARARTIATLRCLGASSALVFAVCLIEIMTLAALGIGGGVVAGAALPLVSMRWLSTVLPVPPVNGVYPGPLVLAAGYGMLTALCFAIWPVGRAARIPGAALFRDAVLPVGTRPARPIIAANAALAAGLVALTVAAAADRLFALWFCAAAAVTLALFQLGGIMLMRAARAWRPSALTTRLGLASLYRPAAPTPLMLVSVGLGLSVMAAVALIEGNTRREVLQQIPADAPSFYFVDIQPDQQAQFDALVQSSPGLQSARQMPNLRARVVAVNGVPVARVHATPDTRWALRGDHGLTYAARPPPGTRLASGSWWPPDYAGKPLVSVDARLARGWGLGVGGTITVDVLGRDVTLTVASLRDIVWQRLGLHFIMVASPGLLRAAPHTNIATVRVAPRDEGALLRRVSDALPNVTGIEVHSILDMIGGLLRQVAAALEAAGSVSLVAGILVLIGAVAVGRRRRVEEAVILKTLGATRAQIRQAWLVEFGALGLTAGAIAAMIGTVASWGVLHYMMHASWRFLPGTLAAILLAALAMMLVFGYAGTAAALRARAAPLLRNE